MVDETDGEEDRDEKQKKIGTRRLLICILGLNSGSNAISSN
jgi:hypothetical protein